MAGTLKWYGSKVIAKVEGKTEGVLDRGSIMIINKVKEIMRQSKTGINYSGKNRRFKTRSSAPREAPAVQTGRLRASIHWLKPRPFMRLIGTNLAYGFFLEVGTSKMAARPYLRPAFKREAPKIVKMLRKVI